MDWMSPMDASFLHIEGPMNPMHIGGGRASSRDRRPPFEALEEMVAGKLAWSRATARRSASCHWALGRPVWVDDPHFNLAYHLRHTALPAPGSDEQLRRTAARIFAQHLDRTKPLWEIWMVEGLEREPLGAALEGPPLHGRRRLRHRPDVGDVRGEPARRRPPTRGSPRRSRAAPSSSLRTLTRRTLNPSEQLRSAARGDAGAPRVARAGVDLLRGMSLGRARAAADRQLVADRAGRPAPHAGAGRTCA